MATRGGQARAWALGTPTSALVHTNVFAAGLTIDARAKAARNRHWDEAFAHLRDMLDRPLPNKTATDAVPAANSIHHPYGYHGISLDDLPEDIDWDVIQRIAGMHLVDDHVLREQEAQWCEPQTKPTAWHDLRFDSRTPGAPSPEWPANTGRDLVRHHLPPQSLWAPDALRLTAMRRRHTWKKLAMQQLSTGLLIHTLLRQANTLRHIRTAFFPESLVVSPQLQEVAAMTEPQAQQARQAIIDIMEKLRQTNVNTSPDDNARASLRVDQPAIPRYVHDADGDFHGICQQMNNSIRQLFQQAPRGNDRIEAVTTVKICHNLLISTAPPDVQTFNTLMHGFKQWRRPKLVDNVISAFYHHKIRPNEIACREIMGHYISEMRPDDFSRFVAWMRGVDDALMLADPNITINEASHSRLVRIDQDKVYQKVYPTPMVFGALIGGVLKFAGFDRALDIYYEMKSDGWGLDVQGLTRLLGDCICRSDWEGGLYVWEEINIIKKHATGRDMAKAYYHMLSLCSITGNTVAFNQVLSEVVRKGFERKSIITAATKLTRRMQKRSGYFAPAWAADNVLIAVSDYFDDARAGFAPADHDDEDDIFQDSKQDGVQADDTYTKTKTSTHDVVDPKEAWASWIEHEFGGKCKDPEP